MELDLSLTCPMNVSNFPFDSHTCLLKFSSFGRWALIKPFDVVPFLRKSDEIRFVRAPDSGEPDAHLDHRKLQDFSADASYLKVIVIAIVKLNLFGW